MRLLPVAAVVAAVLAAVLAAVVAAVAVAAVEPPRGNPQLDPLVDLLVKLEDPEIQRDLLRGIHKAIAGQRRVPRPARWTEVARRLGVSRDAEVRRRITLLSVLFGDRDVIERLKRQVADPKAKMASRTEALGVLVQTADRGLLPLLHKLVAVGGSRAKPSPLVGLALRGLAVYDDPPAARLILDHFRHYTPAERRDAILTLAARPASAMTLLVAVEAGRVDRREISAFTARQISSFGNPRLTVRLEKAWGQVRPTGKKKAERIRQFRELLNPEALMRADRGYGRQVFQKTCAGCHTLFGAGRRVGPDLTGAQRGNLAYLLENLLDPSALVGRDYQLSVIATANGRVVTGVVSRNGTRTITVQTANEDVVLPRGEIEVWKRSPVSMMPEAMLEKLSTRDVVSLFAYLQGRQQVPLPKPDR